MKCEKLRVIITENQKSSMHIYFFLSFAQKSEKEE